MFNFLLAAAPDLESVVAYFNSLPDYLVIVLLFIGFFAGILYSFVSFLLDEIFSYLKHRRINKRFYKSLCDLSFSSHPKGE